VHVETDIYKHTFVHINHHSQSPWPSSWRKWCSGV